MRGEISIRKVLALLARRLLSNWLSTSPSDSDWVPSASGSAWPAQALLSAFVGVEKPGSGGAASSFHILDEALAIE